MEKSTRACTREGGKTNRGGHDSHGRSPPGTQQRRPPPETTGTPLPIGKTHHPAQRARGPPGTGGRGASPHQGGGAQAGLGRVWQGQGWRQGAAFLLQREREGQRGEGTGTQPGTPVRARRLSDLQAMGALGGRVSPESQEPGPGTTINHHTSTTTTRGHTG